MTSEVSGRKAGLVPSPKGVGFATHLETSEMDAPEYDRRTEYRLNSESTRRQKIQALQLMALVGALVYGALFFSGTGLELLALCKALPVFLLLWMVLIVGDRRPYGVRIAWALAACAVGNVCFELEALPALKGAALFPIGVGCFLVGHCTYIYAFLANPSQFTLGATLLPMASVAMIFNVLRPSLPPSLFTPVLLYATIMGVEITLALSRVPDGYSSTSSWRCAVAGTVCFTAASTVLGYDRFSGAVPHTKVVAMTSYYAAQYLLAISAKGSQARPLSRSLGSVENFMNGQSFRTHDD